MVDGATRVLSLLIPAIFALIILVEPSRWTGLTSGLKISSRPHVPAPLTSRRGGRSNTGAMRRALAPQALKDVNDDNFVDVVEKSSIPVLVDFWAPWCGPCRLIEPLIEEISNEYDGRMLTVKLNTDESPATATKLGVRSIPSLMLFKDGDRKDTIVGAVPKATITGALDKVL
ncbi:hypothetical protein AAMO2058_001539600 [Amorphochlora amoebiformis]